MGNADLPIGPCRKHVKAFAAFGWIVLPGRGKGSHTLLAKTGSAVILTIPAHGDVKRGTLGALVRAADITIEDYCKAYRDA